VGNAGGEGRAMGTGSGGVVMAQNWCSANTLVAGDVVEFSWGGAQYRGEITDLFRETFMGPGAHVTVVFVRLQDAQQWFPFSLNEVVVVVVPADPPADDRLAYRFSPGGSFTRVMDVLGGVSLGDELEGVADRIVEIFYGGRR